MPGAVSGSDATAPRGLRVPADTFSREELAGATVVGRGEGLEAGVASGAATGAGGGGTDGAMAGAAIPSAAFCRPPRWRDASRGASGNGP